MLSSYYTMRLSNGASPRRDQLLPGDAVQIHGMLLDSPELAGVHFTGSTAVFNSMWKKVGENMGRSAPTPGSCGETGGKDFIVVHPSAIRSRSRSPLPGAMSTRGRMAPRQPRLRAAVAVERVRDRTVAMMQT